MKARNKNQIKCPFKNTIIVVGSGLPIYWCGLFDYNTKQYIFEDGYEDAGECSYYLFEKVDIEEEA